MSKARNASSDDFVLSYPRVEIQWPQLSIGNRRNDTFPRASWCLSLQPSQFQGFCAVRAQYGTKPDSRCFAVLDGCQEIDIPVDRGSYLLTHLHTPTASCSVSRLLEAHLSGALAHDRVEFEFSWFPVSDVARSCFYYKCKEHREPRSGLEPLTRSLRVRYYIYCGMPPCSQKTHK